MALRTQNQNSGYFFSSGEEPVSKMEVGSDLGWWDQMNRLLFRLVTTKSIFFTTLTVDVFANRVSLRAKPFIGSGETIQTYNANDIGNVKINKSRKYATVMVFHKNTCELLFEVKGLKHVEAANLRQALDKMIAFSYMMFGNVGR